MTAPEPAGDILRAFLDKLSHPARRAYEHHDAQTIVAIRAACERIPVAELARICSVGVEKYDAHNGRGVIVYRLQRESGLLAAQEEPMPPDPHAYNLDDAREAHH